MDILIAGAGALGSLLGARLARSAENVVLFSRNEDHVRAINASGITVEEMDGTRASVRVPALSDPEKLPADPDLVLVLSKSYDTRKVAQAVQRRCGSKPVYLTLQNGVGNWQQIAEVVARESVLAGITAQGATFLGPGEVRHGGDGTTYVGELEGDATRRVEEITEVFSRAGLPAEATGKTQELIWRKLMVNVGINAVTALSRVRNGWIAENEDARSLCGSAVLEASEVARRLDIPVDRDILDRVLAVARATAGNISSMNQDLSRGKPTEVEAINGAVVRWANSLDMDVPVNWTLTRLIRLHEARNEQGEHP
jgi:2-dehydropantoate 2-reductase